MSELLRDEHTTGRVVAVHEQTVHLVTDQGVDFELLVAPDHPVDVAELERFRAAGTRVRVDYEGSPGAHSAHLLRVQAAEAESPLR